MTHRKLLTGLISLGSGLVGPSRQGTYRKLTNFETANYIVSVPTIQLDNEDNGKYFCYQTNNTRIKPKVAVKTHLLIIEK